MKAKLEGDRKKRILVKTFEERRRQLRKELNNVHDIDSQEKATLWKQLRKLPRNSSSTRIKNRCILTGRSRSVYRFFKLSRIELRRRGSQGNIPGLRKASW